MQLGQLAIRGAEPRDGLAPGLIERLRVDAAAQPAAAVQEVIALLHEHLAQARLQHLLAALDAGLDQGGERSVEHRVGGHEVAPGGEGLVEVGQAPVGGGIAVPSQAFPGVVAQRFQAAVEDAAVAEVVKAHARGRDVGLQGGGAGGPLGVAEA